MTLLIASLASLKLEYDAEVESRFARVREEIHDLEVQGLVVDSEAIFKPFHSKAVEFEGESKDVEASFDADVQMLRLEWAHLQALEASGKI